MSPAKIFRIWALGRVGRGDMERRNPRAPPLSIEMHFGSGNLVGEIVLMVIFQVLPLPLKHA